MANLYSEAVMTATELQPFLAALGIKDPVFPLLQDNGFEDLAVIEDMDEQELNDMCTAIDILPGHKFTLLRALKRRKESSGPHYVQMQSPPLSPMNVSPSPSHFSLNSSSSSPAPANSHEQPVTELFQTTSSSSASATSSTQRHPDLPVRLTLVTSDEELDEKADGIVSLADMDRGQFKDWFLSLCPELGHWPKLYDLCWNEVSGLVVADFLTAISAERAWNAINHFNLGQLDVVDFPSLQARLCEMVHVLRRHPAYSAIDPSAVGCLNRSHRLGRRKPTPESTQDSTCKQPKVASTSPSSKSPANDMPQEMPPTQKKKNAQLKFPTSTWVKILNMARIWKQELKRLFDNRRSLTPAQKQDFPEHKLTEKNFQKQLAKLVAGRVAKEKKEEYFRDYDPLHLEENLKRKIHDWDLALLPLRNQDGDLPQFIQEDNTILTRQRVAQLQAQMSHLSAGTTTANTSPEQEASPVTAAIESAAASVTLPP
mmetsp:Transcript_41563/g.81521  ORF Transcript_41563/g.81521 Transcript_41563/m.81521 type:complete len:485 (-) Transcript_41563:78-1532(-)